MPLNQRFSLKDIDYLGLTNKFLAYYVGAGRGANLVGIQSMGFSNVICIEPNKESFDYLSILCKNKLNADKFFCFNLAVSDDEETTSLYTLKTVPMSSSLDVKWLTETRNKEFYKEKEVYEEVTTTYTLDSIISMFGKPGYIYLDVNGFELRALCGLQERIDILSFTFVSELLNNAISCLLRLNDIGFTEYCLLPYNDYPTKDDIWLPSDKCIKSLTFIIDKWADAKGTIFCK